MVFQEPMTSLNPVHTVGSQIGEVVRRHHGLSRRAARARSVELLQEVGIPAPSRRVDDYPHQLSGGMAQRVMIAMAIACAPRILIADEPTTALDVTIQAGILRLLLALRERNGMAILLITHDLGVVAATADRVMVMYAGRRVESAGVNEFFARPEHPYAVGLLGAVRRLGSAGSGHRHLREIPGLVPVRQEPATACIFAPRCPRADAHCRLVLPPDDTVRPDHLVACFHPSSEMQR
jgi:peptide/nickel transport system ATP-binding protein